MLNIKKVSQLADDILHGSEFTCTFEKDQVPYSIWITIFGGFYLPWQQA